jgi:hypothetical protein
MVNAFLGLRTTQRRIRQIAVRRLGGKEAPPHAVDDVIQATNEKALTTSSLPTAPERFRSWVSAIAQHAAVDYLRRQGVEDARFGTDVDVEELPPDPLDAPDELPVPSEGDLASDDPGVASWDAGRIPPRPEPYLIGPWLEETVEKSKGNREHGRLVLEMLRYKARHPHLTDAQVAAVFGLTPAAYESRYRRFRQRYVPLRRRYVERRNTLLLLLLIGGALALVAWLLQPHRKVILIGPDPFAVPLPSASASATRKPFNNAESTHDDEPDAKSPPKRKPPGPDKPPAPEKPLGPEKPPR